MMEQTIVGTNVGFERIRRVTGYLSGDVRRFNNAKRSEVKDRVKHSMEGMVKTNATTDNSGKIS